MPKHCPKCQAVLYSRARGICPECKAPLPDNLRLTARQKADLADAELALERAIAEKKKSAPSDLAYPGTDGAGTYSDT